MTLQYLSGELSVWLGELAQLATDSSDARRIEELRVLSERCPPRTLGALLADVLDASDRMCWTSLSTGHVATFDRQVATAQQLMEFARAAQLINDT